MNLKQITATLFYILITLLLFSCSDKFDGKNGTKTVYFPDSKIVKQIVHYKDGRREGELTEFYRNGNLKIKQTYSNDSLNDSSFSYFENGKLSMLQYLKNRKKEGTWKTFNEQGQLFVEVNYKNNELDGYSRKYSYRSVKLLQQLHYKEGRKDGKQELYYPSGKLKSVAYFSNDRPCLGLEEWTEKGEKIDNDFKITVKEENSLLLNNNLRIVIQLSDPVPDDEIFVVTDTSTNNCLINVYEVSLARGKGNFVMSYNVARGGYVMETVTIAAFRTTAMKNRFIKTKKIIVSATNY
jgi:antitoxin component YwqK of YwqJK toxin-antitoxin module